MLNLKWNLQHIPYCDSTNSELKKALQDGIAQIGDVYLTRNQTQGRGRLNRTWVSPEGNLALSFACPLASPQSQSYQMNLVAGLSLAKTIYDLTNFPTELKWPNDVFVHGKKVAGILSEVLSDQKTVIIGVGLNFNSTKSDFPYDLQFQLTTLRDHYDQELEEDVFLCEFLKTLKEDLITYQKNGLDSLRKQMNNFLAFQNQTLEIRESEDDVYKAQILELNEEGFLNVMKPNGEVRTLVSADIQIPG